jgi:hypothetical protein
MAQDWYPDTQAPLIAWHSNFSTQAANNGTTLGLSAPIVAQIAQDAENVLIMLNGMAAAKAYLQAMAAYKALLFRAPADTPTELAPTAPTTLDFGAASPAMGIEARTREYARMIKASPAYTPDDGELYGIVGAALAPPGTPTVLAVALTASQVRLNIGKQRYSVLAVDSRRGGGGWEQIGVSMTEAYIDERAPLAANAPEVREFRVQGMAKNARVGPYSEVSTVSTTP